LLYSDFHSEAIRAGMTRSFKDQSEVAWTVPHHAYDVACQRETLVAAGLSVEAMAELRMGIELNEVFPKSDQIYQKSYGTPVLLVVRASKR
jgi:hypothetical protein